MGWVALAVAAVGAVASVATSQKAAKSVKKQAESQAVVGTQQVTEQADLAQKQALEQEKLANQLAEKQAALAAKQTEEQAVAANKQAQAQAKLERERAETEADFIRATAEANANQVLVREASEERVLYERQKQWAADTTARAVASGFTLSGSPSFYMEEADRLYTEDLSWRRKIADADAAGLRWEAQTKGDISKWATGEATKALVQQTYDTALRQYQQGIESNRQQVESIAARNRQEVELITGRTEQEKEHAIQRLQLGVDAANAQASAIKTQGFVSALSQIGVGIAGFSAAGGFNSAATTASTGGVTSGLTQTSGSQLGFGTGTGSIGFKPSASALSYTTQGSTNFLLGR